MKILVISSNLIGDTILSTCVVEHFAKKYPKATFTFLIGPSSGQIYEFFPRKDKIILIKKKKFNMHWIDMYLSAWNKKWEIIIDFRSSLLSYFLISKKRYIFKKDKRFNHLDQLKRSFNLNDTSLYVHTNNEDDLLAKNEIDSNFKHVVIFPGGNWKPKIWPSEYYNKLIKILITEYSNLKFVIVGSIEEKKIYLKSIKQDLPDDIFLDIMGKPLTLTSSFMKLSNLFIGNDSGLMHLSIASRLTTISLFGPTDDRIYSHINSHSYVIRTAKNYSDFNKKLIDSGKSYMSTIKPVQIFDLINKKNLL